MGVEKLLDFAGIDVLTAPDDHILHSAGDPAVILFVQGCQIPGVQPALRVDCLPGCPRIPVIAVHHQVAASAQLPGISPGDHLSRIGIDDLDFGMGQGPAHRRDPGLQRIAYPGLGDDRGTLGESIGDGDLPTVHFLNHLFHQLDGTGRAGHDSGPQGAEIDAGEVGVFQLPNEHGRHPVDSGASFFFDRLQRGPGIEGLVGNDHGGSMNGTGHVSQHHPEAVVEGHRNADTIPAGEPHPLTHQQCVVDDVAVGQHGPLGIPRGSGGVLDVDRVIRAQGGSRLPRRSR